MFYEMIGFVSEGAQSGVTEDALPGLDLADASVFLDFDGTLVDIADTPDGIDVPAELAGLLSRLSEATSGRLVIVTGRAIDDFCALTGWEGDVIGAHGAEERTAGSRWQHDMAGSEVVARLGEMVTPFAATHPGMIGETKPTGVVLHFRQAPEHEAQAYAFLRALADGHEGFDLHHSKMAYELRPHGISKDASIARMMDREGFAGTRPVFFGDDVTDEPALAMVAHTEGGVAVKVGPGDTAAPFRVPDPAAARAALTAWVDGAVPQVGEAAYPDGTDRPAAGGT
ncbi:MAG: trehalose-phosphatase [Paracoccaceae bacterium]